VSSELSTELALDAAASIAAAPDVPVVSVGEGGGRAKVLVQAADAVLNNTPAHRADASELSATVSRRR
jgi:hypothetical protein